MLVITAGISRDETIKDILSLLRIKDLCNHNQETKKVSIDWEANLIRCVKNCDLLIRQTV